MMYGSGESFLYFICADCGCLQIAEVPDDLDRHYPSQYYSLTPRPRRKSFSRRLAARWDGARQGGLLAWFCALLRPDQGMSLLRTLGVTPDDAILDVGCGLGDRVAMLAEAGFHRAEGIDAFLPADVTFEGRIIARPGDITCAKGPYRLITFHHSLEHMPDQHEVLSHARKLLADDGHILIRVPTCSSAAWETYRENWVQLDAPRHLYLHSRESLRHLAERHGLKIVRMDDDSGSFQFWGSEQYLRGIHLTDPRSHSRHRPLFSRAQMKAFAAQAKRLNHQGRGDQISAILAPG